MADSVVKQESVLFIENDQPVVSNENNVYPLQLIANVSNPKASVNQEQNALLKGSLSSGSVESAFLDSSYTYLNSDASGLVSMADCSIVLDNEQTSNQLQESQASNTKTRKLPCPKCSFQTTDKVSLECHMRKHNSIFVCKICKIHFPSVSTLIDHYSKRHLAESGEHSEAQHDCPMCPFSSLEKLEYDKHITRHETAAYICQICGQPFAKQVSMKWHVKLKHDINTDAGERETDARLENPGNLALELKSEQMEPISMEELQSEFLNDAIEGEQEEIKPFAKRFSCSFCPKSFSTKLVLRYHAWRSHRERLQINQIDQAGELSLELPLGQKSSGAKSWMPLKRLKSSHQSNSYQYQCPICSFNTIYKSTLDRHIKKHGEAKFDCDICGMPFTVIGNLNHHKKVHHPDLVPLILQPLKRHKCSLCIYNTSYKSTLERHLRTHGIAKYHCNLCAMPFVFTGSFVTHRELKHQIMDKDFQETVFTDKLTDDSKLACGGKFLKRRKCPYCNISMSSASKLNRHLRTHKNAGYFCGSCSVFFHLRSDFENHMRNHLQSLNLDMNLELDRNEEMVQSSSSQKTNSEFGSNPVAQDQMLNTEGSLVTSRLTAFGDMMRETSGLNELPNSMVQIYDKPTKDPSNAPDDVLKIDLTEQRLSKAIPVSRLSENNRHLVDAGDTTLKIVSTCGSADQRILGSGERSIGHLYNQNSRLAEQSYPIVSQSENFQMSNPSFFESQRPDFNIPQQQFVTQVYSENSQNFEMPPKESFKLNRDKPKQQQYFLSERNSAESNVHHEAPNSSHSAPQQPPLSREDSDACACKILQPVHGEVFSNPPLKGRYAKLVSDFDDFASRPFACCLCFFRCSVLKDLYTHVQNHLTGCNMTPTPTSAKFNTGPYLQGLASQGNLANQSHPTVTDIQYID